MNQWGTMYGHQQWYPAASGKGYDANSGGIDVNVLINRLEALENGKGKGKKGGKGKFNDKGKGKGASQDKGKGMGKGAGVHY